MSAGGGLLSQVVGSVGGTQTAALLVVGGIIVGGVAGGAAASGAFSGSTATSGVELAVYPCPDQGPALFTVPGGQRFLVTGRTEDSAWLRIHSPLPGRSEAWVQAGPLTVQGALADLPVAQCAPEIAAIASVVPEPSLTAIQDNSPSPSPTPEPTAPPANARPSLAGLTVSTGKISYDTGSYCPSAVKKATFKVKATDAEGIASVTLFWRKPGAATYAEAAMTRTKGSATSGTWQVTLDTTANVIKEPGNLAFYAVATDTAAATRRLPNKGADSITVAVCENTGPTIKSAASSSGKTLFWNPLGAAGKCPTTTTISATVTDTDGVASVTLFFRRPGESAYQSKPMTLRSGKWSAPIDTGRDKITIPDPPTGNLRWYIKATDKTGLASQTDASTITIKRCDTDAQFDGVFPISQTYPCTTAATITVATYANDADQPNDGLKVVFHWTLRNPRTGAGPISGKMTANLTKGNYYRGTSATFNGQTFYAGSLTVYAVTTDRYGGTTKSPVDPPYSMSCVTP